jgi:hypothetical protein
MERKTITAQRSNLLNAPIKLEGKVAKTTLQILVMTFSIEWLLFFFAIFNITRASHLQKV